MSKLRDIHCRKGDTKRMEEDARRMEMKIELLRKAMDVAPSKPEGGRWKSGNAKKPLTRGYVKDVMEMPRGYPRGAYKGGKSSSQRAVHANSGAEAEVENWLGTQHTGSQDPKKSRSASPAPRPTGPPISNLVALEPPQSRAAANLHAAIDQCSNEMMEVERFLNNLGLDRYISLFMENGFDSMDIVKDMEENHMREIGMAAGHALKLRKKLEELAPERAPAPLKPQVAGHKKLVSFGNDEAMKITVGGSLLEGSYDEAEAASSFQDALRAWRGGRDSDAASPRPTSAGNVGAFWTTMGGGEVDLVCCSTPTAPPTEGLSEIETQYDPAPSEEKLCCYHCYRQFYAKYAVERQCSLTFDCGVRHLCSEACADRWIASMRLKAEERDKRQQSLEKMHEMRRVFDKELSVSETPTFDADPSAGPLVAVTA